MGTSEVKVQYFGQAQSTFDVSIFCICCFPHKLDSLALNYLPGPKLFFPSLSLSAVSVCISKSSNHFSPPVPLRAIYSCFALII